MKKLILFSHIAALVLLTVNVSYASGGHGKRHHHGHHHDEGYYPPPPQYYAPPQPVYQDRRSHQGLAGGVVGSVIGYELGNGHPLATGIGAAAGSFLGNDISGRR